MWKSLGFRESPYNTNPLKIRQEDVELLVGREKEAIELFTALESSSDGILILSGAPGVGKTSFLNIAQFQLESEQAAFGPKLMAARHLCPVQPDDNVRQLSVRALDSLVRSVEDYCNLIKWKIPEQTQKISKWMKSEAASGFEFGIQILGNGGNVGRSVTLPSINEVSFEGIADAISAISAEVTHVLGLKGAVIAFDNMENLDEEQIKSLLISFRDTLFSTPNLWWILIGQSGLGSLIQTLDSRVFERITGSGIEIKPISLDELDEAINKRVARFHVSGNGKAPLPKSVHQELFNASFGEMRFVFKYSNSICTKIVETTRQNVLSQFKTMPITQSSLKETISAAIDHAIASNFINQQVGHDFAIGILKEIVTKELDGLFLKAKEKEVLVKIGEAGKARASDYRQYSIKTMQDFSSNYLAKLAQQNLLVREQEGRAVYYRLRGIARMSHTFNLI